VLLGLTFYTATGTLVLPTKTHVTVERLIFSAVWGPATPYP